MRIRACQLLLLACLPGTPAWGQGGCNISVPWDSYLKEGSPGDNFGADGELSNKNKAGDSFRCVYHFDLSGIPPGSTVNSATAWFYVTAADSGGARRGVPDHCLLGVVIRYAGVGSGRVQHFRAVGFLPQRRLAGR